MGQPSTQQAGFRYRNDDGNEAGATWMYNLDTNGEVAVDTVFRLRILLDEYAGYDEADGYELEYNHNGGGWTDITAISSVMRNTESAENGWTITHGDNTTQQISSGGFSAGKYSEQQESGSFTIAANNYSEIEFCLIILSGDVSDGDTIEVRATFDNGAALDNYVSGKTPSITVQEVSTLPPSVSDSVSVSDSPAAAVSAPQIAVSDAITVADDPTVSVVGGAEPDRNVSASDAVAVADAPTVGPLGIEASSSDAVNVADAPTAVVSDPALSVADTVSVTDAPTARPTIEIALADSVAVAESEVAAQVVTAPQDVSVADAVSIADAPVVGPLGIGAAAGEAIGVADAAGAAVSAPVASASDTVAVTDTPTVSVGAEPSREISVSDAVAVADAPTARLADLEIAASDALSAAEAVAGALALAVAGSDSVAVADTPTVGAPEIPPRTISVSDSVTIGDAVSLDEVVAVGVSEAVAVADVPAPGPLLLTAGVSEAVSVADAAIAVVQVPSIPPVQIAVADAVAINELLWQAVIQLFRLTVTLGDSAVSAVALADALSGGATDQYHVPDYWPWYYWPNGYWPNMASTYLGYGLVISDAVRSGLVLSDSVI